MGLFGAPFGMLYDMWMSHLRDFYDETDSVPIQEDVSSLMTRSMSSLVKDEGDWFNEEEKTVDPEQQISKPSVSIPRIPVGARFRRLTRDISIQNMVLTKLHKRQLSQKGPPLPLPNPRPVEKLKKAVDAVVAQQGPRSKPGKAAHLIAGFAVANLFGPVRYAQVSPASPHLAITWAVFCLLSSVLTHPICWQRQGGQVHQHNMDGGL